MAAALDMQKTFKLSVVLGAYISLRTAASIFGYLVLCNSASNAPDEARNLIDNFPNCTTSSLDASDHRAVCEAMRGCELAIRYVPGPCVSVFLHASLVCLCG